MGRRPRLPISYVEKRSRHELSIPAEDRVVEVGVST
jgi:hypothetical protein